MAPRFKGGGETPGKVVELLKQEVAKSSQAATARATGLTLRGVQNYLKGIGEPTTATLQKLAVHFGTTVADLRGDQEVIEIRCGACGDDLVFEQQEGGRIVVWPCDRCKGDQ